MVTAALCLAVTGSGRAAGQESLLSYVVDLEQSSLFLVTHRAGLFAFLGHEHAIVPTEWTAEICFAAPIPRSAHGRVLIHSASLVIDTDAARALAGLGGGPGEDDLPDLQAKMLDREHLDAATYPEIVVAIDSVAADGDGSVLAFGRMSLHGITRGVTVPMEVEALEDGTTRFGGVLRVRQRDFDIEPESTAGLVKVSDEVDLHFLLVAVPTLEPCTSDQS